MHIFVFLFHYRYSGSAVPPDFISSTNQVLLRYTTDYSNCKDGFVLQYSGTTTEISHHNKETLVTYSLYLIAVLFPESVDGAWAGWGSWGSCSPSCGPGTRSRSRTCTNPTPYGGGDYCPDSSSNSGSCQITPCPGKYEKLYYYFSLIYMNWYSFVL